jgi:hypothetical protein
MNNAEALKRSQEAQDADQTLLDLCNLTDDERAVIVLRMARRSGNLARYSAQPEKRPRVLLMPSVALYHALNDRAKIIGVTRNELMCQLLNQALNVSAGGEG